jgi:protein TonB
MALQKGPTPVKPLVSLFSTDDYPSDAVFKRQSGYAHVVVMVDEKGQIVDCTLIATSGIAVLDAQTCIILRKRGKFTPAIGADGKPTKGIFHQRVNWEMP